MTPHSPQRRPAPARRGAAGGGLADGLAATAPERVTTQITAIGADGDGIARLPDGRPLYLPFALPGEAVEAQGLRPHGGGLIGDATILSASAERVIPPCRHFGTCGGCTLQHWALPALHAWKSEVLRRALDRAGFANAAIGPLAASPPASRRRLDLAFRRDGGGGGALGFHAHRAATIVPITECPVSDPALVRLLAPLAAMLPRLTGIRQSADCAVNLLATGPDLLIRSDGELVASDRSLLARFAQEQGIPRIAWSTRGAEPETAVQLGPTEIALDGVTVSPPAGAFLQATPEGAAAITAAVLAGLPAKLRPRERIVELHAGCGTLTLPLARHARVTAYEGSGAAVLALREAAGRAGLPIQAERRDLVRQPLAAAEFSGVRVVVLDPPYAGAEGQIAALAASTVERIIYVSCNPAALAREAGLLGRAGYTLVAATPIDQFLWSSRLESVVVLERRIATDRRFRPPR